MKVLNLRCALDHTFEGWFASEADFQSQLERGLVACPLCGDAQVSKLPSAPRISISRTRDHAEPSGHDGLAPVSPEALTMQSLWMRAVQHVLAHTDDVGERFPEEARRIHYGEAEERAIRGRASAEDRQALQEEGIEVLAIPLPETSSGPLQ
ncbi:MAG: DUF1178 family protein [Rhizobacter sp.]